jgi:hypothetical protein
MSLIIMPSGGGMATECIKPGSYHGIIYRVYDIGTQRVLKFGDSGEFEYKKQLIVCVEIPSLRIEYIDFEGNTKEGPKVKSRTYKHSTHEKSNFYADFKWVEGIKPREPSDAGLLLTLNCMVSIGNKENTYTGEDYAYIDKISALMEGIENKNPENEPKFFQIEDLDCPVDTPPWIREKIENSEEWKERMGVGSPL